MSDLPQEVDELEARFEGLHSAHRDLLNGLNQVHERMNALQTRLEVLERYFKVRTNA